MTYFIKASLSSKSHSFPFSIFILLLVTIPYAAQLDSGLKKNTAVLFQQVEQSEQENKFKQTDSLFRLLDRSGALNVPYLLKWARTNEILGDYSSMAGIYCRIAGVDGRLADIALRQMMQALDNAPADSIRSAFGIFQKCALHVKDIDTLRIALWFADFYARHGMDVEDLSVLKITANSGRQFVPRLLDMAGEQFARGRFERALLPARIAWEQCRDPNGKNAAARLIFRTFQSLNKTDSAMVWLNRTEITSDNARVDAITLFQNSGKTAEAGKNLDLLGPSFIHDTLDIRQRLFTGDTKGALALVGTLMGSEAWKKHPQESILWKMRTILFDDKTNDLAALFDSQTIDPSWMGAREIFNCRLIFQQLSREPLAVKGWSKLEYGIFIGKSPAVVEFIEGEVSEAAKGVLLLRLVTQLLAKGDDSAAVKLFNDKTIVSDAPEYRYLYGETLVEIGNIGQAQETLTSIIEDSPDDIYSEKARVLLKKIQNRLTGHGQ